jgi:hypothetical protein
MTKSSLEPSHVCQGEGPLPARHGQTNEVLIDRQRGAVTKTFTPPADHLLWRSQAREAAALQLPGLRDLVPRVLALDEMRLTTALLDATPLPELIASADDDSPARCRLAALTGAALRRIHGVRAELVTELAWAGGGDEPWWNGFWAQLVKTADRVSVLNPDLRTLARGTLDALECQLPLNDSFRLGLLHGDYGGANLLVSHSDSPSAQVFVVDWEWAAIGDTAYDLCRIEWLALVGRDPRLWAGPEERAAFYDAYGVSDANAAPPSKVSCYGGLMALGDLVRQLSTHRQPDERIIVWLKSAIAKA